MRLHADLSLADPEPLTTALEATAREVASLISWSVLADTRYLSPELDLRRLRYFVTVAEELHFGRAAKRLQIAQPALSQQIRKLERELGIDLFHRAPGKRVALTEPGVVLLQEGRRVIERATAAALSAQRAARGEIGTLRVGFAPSSALSVLPPSVQLFRQLRPHVWLELEEMLSDELADGLRVGDVDVGILRAPADPRRLLLEVVAEEALFAALPSQHPLAGRRRLSIRALAREPLVASSNVRASGWHRDVHALYRRHGLTPTVSQEASTIQAQLGLVAAGLGIALVPSSVCELRPTGITMLPVQAPLLKLFIARLEGIQRQTVEQFVDLVRTAGAAWAQTAKLRNNVGG